MRQRPRSSSMHCSTRSRLVASTRSALPRNGGSTNCRNVFGSSSWVLNPTLGEVCKVFPLATSPQEPRRRVPMKEHDHRAVDHGGIRSEEHTSELQSLA